VLGNLTVEFTFNGKDVFGNPETVVDALCWDNAGSPVIGATTMFSATNGEFVSDDIDLPPGNHNGYELALVDDEGTTGLRSKFNIQVSDEGPTAPMIGTVTFLPKPVPTSS
jgi:hypothetical protein